MGASGGRQIDGGGSGRETATAGESGEGGEASGGKGATGGKGTGAGGSSTTGGAAGKGTGAAGSVGSSGMSSSGMSGSGESGDGGQGGAGGTDQCGGGGKGPKPPTELRLSPPCVAPLPTGYCLVSEPGEYVALGQNSQAAGVGTVTLTSDFLGHIGFDLVHPTNGDEWSLDVTSADGEPFVAGLYDHAIKYPFRTSSAPSYSLNGSGRRGCTTLEAKFSAEEFARDPDGITRISVTFEQHCDGQQQALRGVVNLNATGSPDPTPTPDWTIPLNGNVFRVAYDQQSNVAYGLDATNLRLSKIDLDCGTVTVADVTDAPNAACVDGARGRLFVVHGTSNTIGEYDTADLSLVRSFPWTPGRDYNNEKTHRIFCAPDRLYVADSAQSPGLFTVAGLDGNSPAVTDHSATIYGIGSIALNASNTSLYYAHWSNNYVYSSVHRLLTSDLSETDTTGTLTDLHANPPDGPILLDEGRGLIFTRNKVYDASDLTTVVHTLPGYWALDFGALENAFALDTVRGRLATKTFVYDLDQYEILEAAVVDEPDQVFFDVNGGLWFLSIRKAALMQQIVE